MANINKSYRMKKVLTFGVFDLMHIGHIILFKNAHNLGDYLIVSVQESDFVTKFKPNTKLFYDTEQRLFMVGAIKFVDEVITYQTVDETIKKVEFDIFAVGSDQNHDKFNKAIAWCKAHNKEVIVLPRTEGVSSSMLRQL